MTGGDPGGPLWASSLADRPRSDYDDVIVRVLEEPEKETPAPPAREPQPGRRRTLVLGVLGWLGVVSLVIALERPGPLTITEVPSGWFDIPMTCHTVRLEREDSAVELFNCRALGGRRLPPGLYRSPKSQWTSDITRRDAKESRIRISPDGELVGSARY